jgi:phenylalanyl-tRNA synthetase beta chain
MRVPLSWLREWVEWPADWDARELARRLTLGGFEIEAIEPAAPAFDQVVVARILTVEPHPQADRMRICRVITAESEMGSPRQIVCGAANARAGLVSALALVGASLPGDLCITAARKRGVESQGMLCSAKELGLSESSEGILELPGDAPLGQDLRRYLDLDDSVLEVNVTPNRGDAMSLLGLARELAALGARLRAPAEGGPSGGAPASTTAAPLATDPSRGIVVAVQPGAGAGRFLAGVLRGVDNSGASPLWMRERLRRAGLRSISPIVDVTNYVMLELGQPMHAYDLHKLRGGLGARRARAGERLELLDGREVTLGEDVLVIADESGPVGLAGIMGGSHTAISAASRDIALEVAWFAPAAIAGRARRYGLTTDASQRFERGVDWRGQERALQRALQLLQQLVGGVAGGTVTAESTQELPRTVSVVLRAAQIERLLGEAVPAAEVERRLHALSMAVRAQDDRAWQVTPPSWRFDIGIEADLIEEVARLGGYEHIHEREAQLRVAPRASRTGIVGERALLRAAAARGYQEIISYAFVDPALQAALLGGEAGIELANPIASDLAVMRASLWPGLISAARENLRRQQSRIRLFELGTRFLPEGSSTREQQTLAGLALGSRLPEQWGSASNAVDFYDIKADVLSLLSLAAPAEEFSFEPAPGATPALHPGRSARIIRGGQTVGVLGELHPHRVRTLELTYAPLLFELSVADAFRTQLPRFQELSRFPRIRRDISVTVPDRVAFAALRERVTVAASSLLKELRVFDVYQGDVVEPGRKSIALGLILQDLNRTLTDADADRVVGLVLEDLRVHLDARLREQR